MPWSRRTPRHRHAKDDRTRSRLLAAVRRPVVGGALAVSLLATVGATVAIGEPSDFRSPTDALTKAQDDPAVWVGESDRSSSASRSAARVADRRAEVWRERRAEVAKKAKAERADRAERKKLAERAEAEKKRLREQGELPVSERHFTREQIVQIRKDPKPYAVELMREKGWPDSEWGCLDSLWVGESDWEWNATNATSGAYGIPQALPRTKMAAAGSDWKTNPITQIIWGLDYIEKSYGSPCEAKTFWDSKDPHWY